MLPHISSASFLNLLFLEAELITLHVTYTWLLYIFIYFAEIAVIVGNRWSSGRMENYVEFREFVELLLQRRVPMGYMLAGSVAELPVHYVMTNLTDFDHMSFDLNLCAVSPTDPFPHKFLGGVLLIETNSVFPGFARLKYCSSWHS